MDKQGEANVVLRDKLNSILIDINTLYGFKRYRGSRGSGSCGVIVTKMHDGTPLDPRLDLVSHSPDGFEWGYGGSGPAQLALAILADFTENDDIALELYQEFKSNYVSKWTGNFWELEGRDIARFLRRTTS